MSEVDLKIRSLVELLQEDGFTEEDNLYDYVSNKAGVKRRTVKIILVARMYGLGPSFFAKENINPIDEHAIYHRFPKLKEALNP